MENLHKFGAMRELLAAWRTSLEGFFAVGHAQRVTIFTIFNYCVYDDLSDAMQIFSVKSTRQSTAALVGKINLLAHPWVLIHSHGIIGIYD